MRWTVLLAAGLLTPVLPLIAQSAATTPQATIPQVSSPANGVTAKPASSTPSKARAGNKKTAAPIAEVPQVATPPPTLEQTPPTAPRITFQNGQLSIYAHNATLAQVLHAVQAQTGASMEVPASASNERVVTQLGPGQPKDVLNSLLNGTKFDYIILGVTGNPGAVQRVILTPRQSSAANVNVAQNNNQGQNQGQMVEDEGTPDEGVPVTNDAEAENPVPEPQAPPPGGFRRPMMQPPGMQVQQEQGQAPNGEQPNGVKTPEQLMQEMQQMQQQQQQYQQQLNPANQNPQ